MIRVLHVVTHMNRGGLETMIMNYYRNIDRTKIQFDFLTHRSEKKDYDDEIESMGGKIYHLPALNPFSLKYRSELNRFFTEHKEYKIVHSHLDCMSSLPLYYAKKHGVPVRIAHSHTSNIESGLKAILKNYYKNRIPNMANNMFSCGEKAGKWMFGENKFDILTNAIDTEKYIFDENVQNILKDEYKLNNKVVLGHVGSFTYPKNHKFLIEIFNEYHNINKESVLMLVGKGVMEQEIKTKVVELDIEDSVLFMGLRDDIPIILNAVDLFVFPSIFEGFPVSLVEAQASGLNCVISDNISDEVKLTEGIYEKALNDSAYEWATMIDEVIKKKSDRKNAYDVICNAGYDIKSNAKWLEEYYLEKAEDN